MAEPITETEVLTIIRRSLVDAITESMKVGYGNPIGKIVEACIIRHKAELESRVDDLISSTLSSMDFREDILRAFKDKVARVIVSKADGAVEKTVNEYRQNPIFRAKLTLAIERLIAEFDPQPK